MSMAARNAASISKCVVSSKCASGAGLQGAARAVVSRSSRRRMSASTSASSDHRAGGLQLGRAAGRRGPPRLQCTKIFTSASGKMTVPMSRPSSTAPGGVRPKLRWNASSAPRTSGIAETSEAASPTAWLLSAACRNARDRAPRRRQRRAPDCRANGRHRAAPSPPPGRSGRYRGAAGHSGRPAACRACPCRTPPARRWR